jgi:Predicted AAA-ATPase
MKKENFDFFKKVTNRFPCQKKWKNIKFARSEKHIQMDLPLIYDDPNHIFVDKTGFLFDFLLRTNKGTIDGFFLLRPRRFGKSTFLNLIQEYYTRPTLFADMKIGKLLEEAKKSGRDLSEEEGFLPRPVVLLDMAELDVDNFKSSLVDAIKRTVKSSFEEFVKFNQASMNYKVFLKQLKSIAGSPQEVLLLCASLLFGATGKKIVLLIDEFDTLLSNCLEDQTDHSSLLAKLKSFYRVLKGKSEIFFSLLTGATPLLKPVRNQFYLE